MDLKIPQAQVNDPSILDIVPLSPTEIQVSAKNPGTTAVNLWDENKQRYTINVIVSEDMAVYNKAQLDAEILAVLVYREKLASVVSRLEFPPRAWGGVRTAAGASA